MRKTRPRSSAPLAYLITDRLILPRKSDETPFEALIELVSRAVQAGVDLIQIREKDLNARQLLDLTSIAVECAEGTGTRILVNDRVDVALAAGAHGVHLTTRSMSSSTIRNTFGPSILIGVSTHSFQEASRAEEEGADFVVFGPVFETDSKRGFGPPTGPATLKTVAAGLRIPVLGIGGVSRNNLPAVLAAGAAGIAGISIFILEPNLRDLISTMKGPLFPSRES